MSAGQGGCVFCAVTDGTGGTKFKRQDYKHGAVCNKVHIWSESLM